MWTHMIDCPVQCIVVSVVFVRDGETEWVLSEIGRAAFPVLPLSFVSILWGRTALLANSKQCKCITRPAGSLTTYKHKTLFLEFLCIWFVVMNINVQKFCYFLINSSDTEIYFALLEQTKLCCELKELVNYLLNEYRCSDFLHQH